MWPVWSYEGGICTACGNTVSFGSTYYAEGDPYLLLYVSVWNKYGDMFTMVITGIEDVEDLHVGIKLVSSTNTVYGAAPVAVN